MNKNGRNIKIKAKGETIIQISEIGEFYPSLKFEQLPRPVLRSLNALWTGSKISSASLGLILHFSFCALYSANISLPLSSIAFI